MMFEVGHQVAQASDGDDRYTIVALDLLHCREFALAAFLASEEAASITGSNYSIDGGWTAQ